MGSQQNETKKSLSISTFFKNRRQSFTSKPKSATNSQTGGVLTQRDDKQSERQSKPSKKMPARDRRWDDDDEDHF